MQIKFFHWKQTLSLFDCQLNKFMFNAIVQKAFLCLYELVCELKTHQIERTNFLSVPQSVLRTQPTPCSTQWDTCLSVFKSASNTMPTPIALRLA